MYLINNNKVRDNHPNTGQINYSDHEMFLITVEIIDYRSFH